MMRKQKPHIEIMRRLGACEDAIRTLGRYKHPGDAWRWASFGERLWLGYRIEEALRSKGYTTFANDLHDLNRLHGRGMRKLKRPNWEAILEWLRANKINLG